MDHQISIYDALDFYMDFVEERYCYGREHDIAIYLLAPYLSGDTSWSINCTLDDLFRTHQMVSLTSYLTLVSDLKKRGKIDDGQLQELMRPVLDAMDVHLERREVVTLRSKL